MRMFGRVASLGMALCLLSSTGFEGTTNATAAEEPQAAPKVEATLDQSVDRMTDEWAGKGLDLKEVAHSPKDGSPYLGPADALVVVNIFTDYQCPVCTRAANPVKQLVADYPGKVKVFIRNNALPTHARAEAAARGAIAAAQQGRFWDYYDKLFGDMRSRDDASLRRFAADLGLNLEQWDKDFADPAAAEWVKRESAAAIRLGVPGTPGIFVNGVRQMGWGSYRDLHATVGREITAGQALVAAGKPLESVPAERIRLTADKNYKKEGEAAPDVEDWVKTLLAK
jgi:protein-disulfide isomerase